VFAHSLSPVGDGGKLLHFFSDGNLMVGFSHDSTGPNRTQQRLLAKRL